MNLYAGSKHLGAVYIECAKAFGMKPLFMLENCNGEIVVNLPYTQIILTPARKLKNTAPAPDEGNTGNGAYYETGQRQKR
jgi:hypothetical protein